jgi:FAD/FMN-containing dehydrogenase
VTRDAADSASDALTSFGTAILTAADGGWDEARRAWNLTVDQHPAAIAVPRSPEEVVAAVNVARERGLRVAAQGTGHSAASLGPLAGTMLIKTSRMRGLSVDPAAGIARAEAGVTWGEVVERAAGHGLAALAGSSPDVGVVGYTLGGGVGWLGRRYGLSANNVEAFEVVTADGRLLRADAGSEPDLFWALRGGGGSFGVVTAVELRLFPVTEVYAGLLFWPLDAAAEVLQAWAALTRSGLPEDLTTTARLLRFPGIPDVPEFVRGKSFAVIDVVHLGTPAQADALLAPLRALRPVRDTVETMPAPALGHLHMDPEQPAPFLGDGLVLDSLPAQAIDATLRLAGPVAPTPLLVVEFRHIGGQMRRPQPGNGALAALDGDYLWFAGGIAPTPEASTAVAAAVADLKSAMRPWAARQMYLNSAETHHDPGSFWTPDAYQRLRRIKATVDPHDIIRSNHPIPPAA